MEKVKALDEKKSDLWVGIIIALCVLAVAYSMYKVIFYFRDYAELIKTNSEMYHVEVRQYSYIGFSVNHW